MLKNDVIDQQHLSMMQKAIKKEANVEEAFLTGIQNFEKVKNQAVQKMFAF